MSKENKVLIKDDNLQKIKIYEAKIKDLILAFKNVSKEKDLMQETLNVICGAEKFYYEDILVCPNYQISMNKEKLNQICKLVCYLSKQKLELELTLLGRKKQMPNQEHASSITAEFLLLQDKLKNNIKEKNDLFLKNIMLETELIQKEMEFNRVNEKLNFDYREKEECLLKLCKEKENRISNLEEKITQVLQSTANYEEQKLSNLNKISLLEAKLTKAQPYSVTTTQNEIQYDKAIFIQQYLHKLHLLSRKVILLKTDLNQIKKDMDFSEIKASNQNILESLSKYMGTFKKECEKLKAQKGEKCHPPFKTAKILNENADDKDASIVISPAKEAKGVGNIMDVISKPGRSIRKGTSQDSRKCKHKSPTDTANKSSRPPEHIYYYQQESEGKEKLIKYLKNRLYITEGSLRDSQQHANSLEFMFREQLKFLKNDIRNLEMGASFKTSTVEPCSLALETVSVGNESHKNDSSLFLYVRNLFLNYLKCEKRDVKARKSIIRAISTVLKFTPEEITQINKIIMA